VFTDIFDQNLWPNMKRMVETILEATPEQKIQTIFTKGRVDSDGLPQSTIVNLEKFLVESIHESDSDMSPRTAMLKKQKAAKLQKKLAGKKKKKRGRKGYTKAQKEEIARLEREEREREKRMIHFKIIVPKVYEEEEKAKFAKEI
jgi:hypothetical protein